MHPTLDVGTYRDANGDLVHCWRDPRGELIHELEGHGPSRCRGAHPCPHLAVKLSDDPHWPDPPAATVDLWSTD
jgi:hypothetical protein